MHRRREQLDSGGSGELGDGGSADFLLQFSAHALVKYRPEKWRYVEGGEDCETVAQRE